MKRWLKRIFLAGLVLFALIQLVPYGRNHTNPPVTKEPAWPSPRVRELAVRACFDCHSHESRWPWYSHVAPVSWLLVDDVNAAREEMNLSEWAQYQPDEAVEILEDACGQMRARKMPLPKYIALHPGTRLSDAEIAVFCSWTESLSH